MWLPLFIYLFILNKTVYVVMRRIWIKYALLWFYRKKLCSTDLWIVNTILFQTAEHLYCCLNNRKVSNW